MFTSLIKPDTFVRFRLRMGSYKKGQLGRIINRVSGGRYRVQVFGDSKTVPAAIIAAKICFKVLDDGKDVRLYDLKVGKKFRRVDDDHIYRLVKHGNWCDIKIIEGLGAGRVLTDISHDERVVQIKE